MAETKVATLLVREKWTDLGYNLDRPHRICSWVGFGEWKEDRLVPGFGARWVLSTEMGCLGLGGNQEPLARNNFHCCREVFSLPS